MVTAGHFTSKSIVLSGHFKNYINPSISLNSGVAITTMATDV